MLVYLDNIFTKFPRYRVKNTGAKEPIGTCTNRLLKLVHFSRFISDLTLTRIIVSLLLAKLCLHGLLIVIFHQKKPSQLSTAFNPPHHHSIHEHHVCGISRPSQMALTITFYQTHLDGCLFALCLAVARSLAYGNILSWSIFLRMQ